MKKAYEAKINVELENCLYPGKRFIPKMCKANSLLNKQNFLVSYCYNNKLLQIYQLDITLIDSLTVLKVMAQCSMDNCVLCLEFQKTETKV